MECVNAAKDQLSLEFNEWFAMFEATLAVIVANIALAEGNPPSNEIAVPQLSDNTTVVSQMDVEAQPSQ